MSGSATGILKNDTLWVFGSRIGMLSVEYSGDAVERAVGVDRRIAPVGRDQVVHEYLSASTSPRW